MTDVTPPWAMPAAQMEGTRLAGYRLEARIGWGGMAVVYRAHDDRLDRQVALKVLAPALAEDVAFRHRFMRESRAAAAVEDPNIIPVYEAGEADGVLFIAMRLVRGGNVRTLVGQQGPLAPGRAVWIISAIASALDTAHAAGLVHRDVKPANMLLEQRPGRPDHVYLSDFGVSKTALASTGLTGTGQFLGTIDYAAPEQIQGTAVDGRTDQYALGCSAFELLSGEPPYARDQPLAVVYAHVTEPPPSLAARLPGIPREADAVLARAMAKSPADRYPSCQEFAEALSVALGVQSFGDSATATQPAIQDQPQLVQPDTVDRPPRRRKGQDDGRPGRWRRAAVPGPPSQPTEDEAVVASGAGLAAGLADLQAAPDVRTEPPAGEPAGQPAVAGAGPAARAGTADRGQHELAEPDLGAGAGPGTAADLQPGIGPGSHAEAGDAEQAQLPGADGAPSLAAAPAPAQGPTVLIAGPVTPDTTDPSLGGRAAYRDGVTSPSSPDTVGSPAVALARRGRRRLALTAAAVVVAVAGAAAGLLLSTSPQPRPQAGPASYTFPLLQPAAGGLTLSQVWRLAGHDGNQLTVTITVHNPSSKPLAGQVDEPVPAAINPSGQTISFLPGPVPQPSGGYSVLTWTGLKVSANSTRVIGYRAVVTAGGTARSRLLGWVHQVSSMVKFMSQPVTTTRLVSLRIGPAHVRLAPGGRKRLTLTGQLSNGRRASAGQLNMAVWTSSDRAVASVSPAGTVTAHAAGRATVTAEVGRVRSAAKVVVISPARQSNPTTSYTPPTHSTPPPHHSSPPVGTTTASSTLGPIVWPTRAMPSPEPQPAPAVGPAPSPAVTFDVLAESTARATGLAAVPRWYLTALMRFWA